MDFFDQMRLTELLEQRATSRDAQEVAAVEKELLDMFLPKLIERVTNLEAEKREVVNFKAGVMPSYLDRIYRHADGKWMARTNLNTLEFRESGPPPRLVKTIRGALKGEELTDPIRSWEC